MSRRERALVRRVFHGVMYRKNTFLHSTRLSLSVVTRELNTVVNKSARNIADGTLPARRCVTWELVILSSRDESKYMVFAVTALILCSCLGLNLQYSRGQCVYCVIQSWLHFSRVTVRPWPVDKITMSVQLSAKI